MLQVPEALVNTQQCPEWWQHGGVLLQPAGSGSDSGLALGTSVTPPPRPRLPCSGFLRAEWGWEVVTGFGWGRDLGMVTAILEAYSPCLCSVPLLSWCLW
jgi:hypothetical protein